MGDVSALFPPGISSVADLPYPLFEAVRMAAVFTRWQDNLEEDEMPPRHIWLDEKLVTAHFDGVKRARKAKYGGDKAGPIEDPVGNEAATSLVVE